MFPCFVRVVAVKTTRAVRSARVVACRARRRQLEPGGARVKMINYQT